jgi:hypothetical protein
VLEAWFFIAAALLVLSGGSKIVDPAPTRGALAAAGLPAGAWTAPALGGVEIIAGLTGIALGSWAAASAGLIYAGFGAFVIYALVRRLPIQSCGCFGKSDTPPTWTHVGFNLISAAGGIGIAFSGTAPISLLADQPALGIPYLGFVAIGVVVVYLLLAELPQLRTAST